MFLSISECNQQRPQAHYEAVMSETVNLKNRHDCVIVILKIYHSKSLCRTDFDFE